MAEQLRTSVRVTAETRVWREGGRGREMEGEKALRGVATLSIARLLQRAGARFSRA